MTRRILPSLIAGVAMTAASAAFAPAPVYKEPPKPAVPTLQQAMQGTWGTAGRTPRVRIAGKTWTMLSPAPKRAGRVPPGYEIHLDATRDPAALDLRIPELSRVLMRGIVKLEGDRLIFCYTRSDSEEDRPKAFTDAQTGNGVRVRTMTLTRIEPPAISP